MKFSRLAATLSTAGMLGAGLATTAASAAPASSASTVPVIYAAFGNWQRPKVEPRAFALGANFWLSGLRWTRWSSVATAYGTDNWANGNAGHLHRWASTVTLYKVKTHHGHRYFDAMKIASHGHRTIRLTYRSGGWFQS